METQPGRVEQSKEGPHLAGGNRAKEGDREEQIEAKLCPVER